MPKKLLQNYRHNITFMLYRIYMLWTVILSDEYEHWFHELLVQAQKAIATDLEVLKIMGPQLGRPYVDHVKGSRFPNMKELRTRVKGNLYRSLFAFDLERQAVLLVGGDKKGKKDRSFYQQLIARADSIFERHLQNQRKDIQKTSKEN